ncbi:DUF4291 domain-containing protein [Spongiimicrobium salis]|uniref:DUF4291 domain-containing protein n=1 Tax=Spongiimicrobium salis TaxID=1667022 RepID=UPI00374D37B1
MNLQLEHYKKQQKIWPQNGHHIMAQFDEEKIIVYQSYRSSIGRFAVENQFFGGDFSLTRMTWIKPNFLWMMYRNGWGTKEGQEVILAIHLKRKAFERYLKKAVYSSYQEEIYGTREAWVEQVKNSNIRLQWDPDHDPYGAKLERRAIQLGIRNQEIESYAKDDILMIEDISDFVGEQRMFVTNQSLERLQTPLESPYMPYDRQVAEKLKLV